MKKLVSTIVTTSAAAAGLLFAGVLNANADSTYTVKSGDSVWAIAQKFNTTINHVETTNNIKGHYILPGQNYLLRRVQPVLITTPRQRLQTQRVQVLQRLVLVQLATQPQRPLQRVQLTPRLQATPVAI